MTKAMKGVRCWSDGERKCSICGAGLPAHEGWGGQTAPLCGSVECGEKVKIKGSGVYIEAGTKTCALLGCPHHVPEGRYRKGSNHCCSRECWTALNAYGTKVHSCACCGVKFNGVNRPADGRPVFLNHGHLVRYKAAKKAENLRASVGAFQNEYDALLQNWEKTGRAQVKRIAWELSIFLHYLVKAGISDLNQVRPSTITAYLDTEEQGGLKSVGYTINTVSSFFTFLYYNDLRDHPTPVVRRYHARKRSQKLPNPLTGPEVKQLWEALETNGTPMLRLAAAIAVEAGLRAGEVCNVRLEDMKIREQKIIVRLPNKGGKVREAWFSDRTKRYYDEWMAVRPVECGHDGLLVTRTGKRLSYGILRWEYARALQPGTSLRAQGQAKESVKQHRMRHTFATDQVRNGTDLSVLKVLGGWKSLGSMEAYLGCFDEDIDRQYHQAIKKSRERVATPPQTRTLTLAEGLARKRAREQSRSSATDPMSYAGTT
jgi:site-specific recombinase XerD